MTHVKVFLSKYPLLLEFLKYIFAIFAPCKVQSCKNRPTPFPGQMSCKATNQVLSVLNLSMVFIVLFIRAPFYVLLVFVCICSVFWLFWLICQYLPSDWLERLLWGSLTMARGLSPQCPGWRLLWSSWFIVLFHCSIVWLSCPPAVRYMLHTPVAWYSLFVLKVLLNNNKPNHFAILLAKHRHIATFISVSSLLMPPPSPKWPILCRVGR